ncbi:NACHT domain-containing protein [Actinokineospora inagensis]|uniref:NACHT domain-containing protein n=1 Tax=Actinokineospora inagensis TaxID=103730 RepID=UPI00047D88A9|nr:NACHT domain-containing protein [Actinokineospora inagensis]
MTGTVVTVVLGAVAVVLAFAAKQFFGEYFKKSGASAFDRSASWFSGRAKFGRRLVRRYAEAIARDFPAHAMGFVTDRTIDIDDVYVPLQYERGGERQDIYENIREKSCSVVIGPAGAGKSMLLKHSMLLWARQPRSTRVPVLIELHRCNASELSLVDHIVAELSRSRLNRGERIRDLVLRGLTDGSFALLLDGLDEVSRDDRHRVHEALRDLVREYPDCQYIVTCRDVVYQGQPLGPAFSHVVRVAEFDDAAVVRFLRNWRGLANPTELFTSLRTNPALMRLARSPLLLTMVVYLHTEVLTKSGRRLPTSRPAFYQEAIAHLLDRDAQLGRDRSIYQPGEKLAVLQQVALRSMELTGDDRRTIARRSLEATTKKLLPDLNLDQKHVKDLIDEIIERSQLLVAVDSVGVNFTFGHLTLQEYLTAVELADDPDGLLSRYAADPSAWRETVKLWCGATTRDSTKVIRAIFATTEPHHRILALECLAEATRVDADFADDVIQHFLARLDSDDPDWESIIAALGAVASDTRPRGIRVFDELTRLARVGNADAALALAASGLTQAADVLAGLVDQNHSARAALWGMGELALPALAVQAANAVVSAVDDIGRVGTPAAAEVLAGLLLWSSPDAIAVRAAWRLAQLLPNPGVEQQLRELTPPTDVDHEWDWVWQPFASGRDDPLTAICGRMAALLHGAAIPQDITTIDSRLAIPLAVLGLKRSGTPTTTQADEVSRLAGDRPVSTVLEDRSTPDELVFRICEALVRIGVVSPVERLLGRHTRSALAVLGWSTSAVVRTADWSTVRDVRGQTSHLWRVCKWGLGAIGGGTVLAGAIRCVLSLLGLWPLGPDWLSWSVLAAVVLFGVATVTDGLDWAVFELLTFLYDSLLGMGICIAAGIVLFVFGVVSGFQSLPLTLLGVIFALAAAAGACGWLARKWDRVRDNPFRRVFDAENARIDDRASVIAS